MTTQLKDRLKTQSDARSCTLRQISGHLETAYSQPGSYKHGNVRSNPAWVMSLRGEYGHADQRFAHEELSAYLYTTAWNYLLTRQPTINRIARYSPDDLGAVAEDFVQQCCMKLIQDRYALLTKYDGRGRFLSWAAQVQRNLIRSEVRRRCWQECERLEEKHAYAPMQSLGWQCIRPEQAFQSGQIAEIIENKLARLSSRNHTIFIRYMLDGERATTVAKELGITAAGVYTAAHRIREKMGEALAEAGYAY